LDALEIRIQIASGKRQEFFQAVEWFLSPDECGVGCVDKCVFERIDAPNHFVWIERWSSSSDFEEYRSSERFKALLGAVEVLGDMEVMQHSKVIKGPMHGEVR
jgi:quinol monooxygenase YgiN